VPLALKGTMIRAAAESHCAWTVLDMPTETSLFQLFLCLVVLSLSWYMFGFYYKMVQKQRFHTEELRCFARRAERHDRACGAKRSRSQMQSDKLRQQEEGRTPAEV
jgi:hypothetical protein